MSYPYKRPKPHSTQNFKTQPMTYLKKKIGDTKYVL